MANGTGIGEFFISLTVDAANGALTVNELVQGMGALEVATLAEIGLLWELAVQLARITDEGIKASLGFAQFSMHTGLSAQELQKWQIVAEQAHGSAGDVTQSVESLTRKLADMETGGTGGGALGALQRLFISPFGADGRPKQAFAVLDEVRARLGSIHTAAQQEAILGALGISPNLRETLLLSETAFQQLAGVAHGMTKGQQEDFDELRGHFVRIHLVAQDIARDIGDWVAKLDKASGALSGVESFFRGIRNLLEGKSDLFKLSPEQEAQYQKNKREEDAQLERMRSFFSPSKETGAEAVRRLLDELRRPADAGYLSPGDFQRNIERQDERAGRTVVIDKHDTYHIETNDPEAMKKEIEKHWDETFQKKTIDGFDRQLNNGGY